MKLLSILPILLGIFVIDVSSQDAPIVSTEEGRISGITEKSTNGNTFYSYFGIPFAKPPLGDLRFKDPVEPDNWSGIRDGSLMPKNCINLPFGLVAMGIKLKAEELPGSEDCLYLNVFTPKSAVAGGADGLPVMMFIHGGGFFAGGAFEYLPHALLNRNIVLVVIQYRLGFLGFMSTEDSVMSGNYGLKDQTMALKWIQRNIHNFGGNPNKVTIFGESAGGASVQYLMLSPKAKGLFNHAIMQSGSSSAPWAISYEHKKVAKQVGSTFGCEIEKGSQEFMKCMQQIDPREVNRATQDYITWIFIPILVNPRIDGDFLPDHPLQLMKSGRFNKVSLMTGVTAHEGSIVTASLFSSHGGPYLDLLKNDFDTIGPVAAGVSTLDKNISVSLSKQIFNYYVGGLNIEKGTTEELTEMLGDVFFNNDVDITAQLHSREGTMPTFLYEFTHRGQLSFTDFSQLDFGSHWVCHVDELYYLFRGGPLLTPSNQPLERLKDLASPEDLAVREIMLSLWTNFATYGNPTPDDSLGFKWEPLTGKDELKHLDISLKPSMKEDARKEARRFLQSLPTHNNKILNPSLFMDHDLIPTKGTHDEL